MSFVAGLLRRLLDDRQVTLATAASDAYTDTLYQYHGWITSAAFTVALKVSQMRKLCLTKHMKACHNSNIMNTTVCINNSVRQQVLWRAFCLTPAPAPPPPRSPMPSQTCMVLMLHILDCV